VITVVDAAHCPGSRSVDVVQLGADFWTGNFHKWASAPRPCAALAVAEPWRERTQPLVASFGLEAGMPQSFAWQGTNDYTSYLGLGPALEVLEQFGWATLWQHNDDLAAWAGDLLADALGVEPALPTGARASMSLAALPAGVATTDDDARALIARVSAELGVEVAASPWRGRGWLRVSAHAYNDESDYERLAKGLPALLARR
jgi:isopenicillin-N epimerase